MAQATVIPVESSAESLPRVVINGATLEPQPERALLWLETATLFVADLHLGKAATFRDHAIPLPTGTTQEDLLRLTNALRRTDARRLVVLGDLFHSSAAQDERFRRILADWRGRHPGVELAVVPGNHDRHAGAPRSELGWIELNDSHRDGPFCLRHVPHESEQAYVLAGHIHPVVRVRDGRESLRLPCFHFTDRIGTLPAFSVFTGGTRVHPRPDDYVFVPADSAVIRVR